MKSLLVQFLIVVVAINLSAQNINSKHFAIEQLSNGVYAAIYKAGDYAICNAGIVDLGDETWVFDCFISPEAVKDLKKAAEELTGNPVRCVVNRHYHNDHIRGNQVFDGARIIATQKTKDIIEKNEPEELEQEKRVVNERIETENKKLPGETDLDKIAELNFWLDYYKAIKGSFAEYKITLPNYIMEDSLWLKGSKREVLLFSKGRGHTENDLVLWLPKEKILFAGDILFVKSHPWLGDGFLMIGLIISGT